ncbi:MAG TPA: VOC family protein [Steroidobacteraceae bacterium]|nr:VOC family protein [Steroidobacteraceae bacterium]
MTQYVTPRAITPRARQATSSPGWVKDRYGVSWQIVPRQLTKLFGDPDPHRKERAFEAMMKMKRIDIAAIERAADGVAE